MQKFTDALVNFSSKMANNRVLQTIQQAFMMMLPITMIGSFASLFKGISIGGYQAFLQSSGLYGVLGAIYQFSVGLLALYVVFLVGYVFAQKFDVQGSGISIGLTALMCFLVVTPYTEAPSAYEAASIPTSYLGASGMFTALIVAFITGFVFKFCKQKNIEIKMPDSVPPMIAKQFSAIIPGVFATVIFAVIRMLFTLTPIGNMQAAIYTLVSAPLQGLGANYFGLWILYIVLYAMWFFGIHGGMTCGPIIMLLFTQLQMENLAAYQAGQALPHLMTGTVVSFGSGSLPLVIAMLLTAKSSANKTITKIGALPSLFGVDEPMYFGLPMILNPIFFVPWVILVPTFTVWGTCLLQNLGLLGAATGASAGSFVPFFVTNMVSFGISGVIWGCVFMVVDVLIYLPFAKAYDKQLQKQEAETLKEKEAEA